MDMSNKGKWEWFKFETKRLAIETGKSMSKTSKLKQKEILKRINIGLLCGKTNASEEELTELNSLQKQLDEIYLEKASGAFVRSRARWIEEGEKNTTYFYGLEKSR